MTPKINQYQLLPPWQLVLLAFIFWVAIFQLAHSPQHDFHSILISASISFSCYGLLLYRRSLHFWHMVAVGLVARCLLIGVFPALSDDIYRFVWDGQLISQGYNPYSHLPSDIIQDNIVGITPELFTSLNSPNYYTIYPPVAQLMFWLSALWSDIEHSAITLQLLFLLAECLTLLAITRLLAHVGKDCKLAAVYWLSPLIIIEGVGNLHFEIIMLCTLLWSVYYLFVKENHKLSAALMAISIASKLLPLMLLPYIVYRLPWRSALRYLLVLGGLLLLMFIPIFMGIQITNFASSVDLYFQKFEFNASVYYLLRYLGQIISGYNLIYYLGPALGIITVYLIVKHATKNTAWSVQSFFKYSLFSFTAYLLLATTVHPWYLTLPIAFAVFTESKYVLAWSALIFLTYINYSYSPYFENLWIVALEYSIVAAILLYESIRHQSSFMTLAP